MIEEYNIIARLTNQPEVKLPKYIEVEHEDQQYDITVWLKREPTSEEFAGENEDGFRWVIVHNGMKTKPNYKPF